MTPLQLAAQTPGNVALAGHVARFRVLLVLVHGRPAHPRRGHALFGLRAHQAGLAVAVPSAQLANPPAVREQAGAHHCNQI